MDTDWAIAQCNEWLRLNEREPIPEDERDLGGAKTRLIGSREERSRLDNRIHLIAVAIWDERTNGRWWLPPSPERVRKLIFELEEGSEVRDRLGLTDAVPSIEAGEFHPWVWDAAKPHWDSGNFDAAVWAAAINVNHHLKSKAERPGLGESKLVREAFSTTAPERGRVRLRLCEEANPDLFRDRHVGALNFGQGLISGVRNPLSHVGAPDLSEQNALEALAAWSVFARWVADSAVIRAAEF